MVGGQNPLEVLDEALIQASDPDEAECIRLAGLRSLAGQWMVANAQPEEPCSVVEDHFAGVVGLPEIDHRELHPEVLASGLAHGAMVVRSFLTGAQVATLRARLDSMLAGAPDEAAAAALARAALPPRGLAELFDAYKAQGFIDVVASYLGGRPVVDAHRTKLTRNRPAPGLLWHQDAVFLQGRRRSVNVWIALTDVGDRCPGLDIVPRGFDHVVGFTWESLATLEGRGNLGYIRDLPPDLVDSVLEANPPVTPVLAPGDAVVFDEMTMHRTGVAPWELPSREVAATWFFHPGRCPPLTVPSAV